MRNRVNVSLVQFAPAWLQRDQNADRMCRLAEREAQAEADLIVFPELANIGYITPVLPGEPPSLPSEEMETFAQRYVASAELIPGPTTERLADVARKYNALIVVGIAQRHPTIATSVYNTAALISSLGVLGVQQKVHLAFNEKHFFCPGDQLEVFKTELGTIGVTVCYDGRFPEASRVLTLKGAEIICALHASPYSTAAPDYLRHRSATRAQENGVWYLACNRTGTEGKTVFFGHSVVAGPDGAIVAYSESSTEDVLRAELTAAALERYRLQNPIYRDRRPELYGLIAAGFSDQASTAILRPNATSETVRK